MINRITITATKTTATDLACACVTNLRCHPVVSPTSSAIQVQYRDCLVPRRCSSYFQGKIVPSGSLSTHSGRSNTPAQNTMQFYLKTRSWGVSVRAQFAERNEVIMNYYLPSCLISFAGFITATLGGMLCLPFVCLTLYCVTR